MDAARGGGLGDREGGPPAGDRADQGHPGVPPPHRRPVGARRGARGPPARPPLLDAAARVVRAAHGRRRGRAGARGDRAGRTLGERAALHGRGRQGRAPTRGRRRWPTTSRQVLLHDPQRPAGGAGRHGPGSTSKPSSRSWSRSCRCCGGPRRRGIITSASRAGDVLGDRRSLERWHAALAPGTAAVTVPELLTTLQQLEVASTTIGDETMTGSTIPIEVVQLSAQTRNAFARYSMTGDDKLGGWSVKRFGGFLKRSWRVNDWTWGRLDAATVLCRAVLDPARVRRAAYLSGYLATDADPRRLAQVTVDHLVDSLFAGSGLATDPRVVALREAAVAELLGAFTVEGTPTSQLPPSMPALADLFAWGVQLDVVPEEVAALASAVREDRADGANPRSRGELFLAAEEPLLTRLEKRRREGSPVSGKDRAALLAAFDRAGVGREPLADETSSDLMIRSASTAGAVSATVLDSPSSGLGRGASGDPPRARGDARPALDDRRPDVARGRAADAGAARAVGGQHPAHGLAARGPSGGVVGGGHPVRRVVRARGVRVRGAAHGHAAARARPAEPHRAAADLRAVPGTQRRRRGRGRGCGPRRRHPGRDDPGRDRAARAREPARVVRQRLAGPGVAGRSSRGGAREHRRALAARPARGSVPLAGVAASARSLPGLLGPAVVIAVPVLLAWWLVDTGPGPVANWLLSTPLVARGAGGGVPRSCGAVAAFYLRGPAAAGDAGPAPRGHSP